MSLVLYQFPPVLDLPNVSPFCMKLETYLRMAGQDYRTVLVRNPRQSPTGKVPFIEIDGEVMTDSGLIIDHLESRNGHRVDGDLTPRQKADSLAWRRLMEEHLMWIVIYSRWIDEAGSESWREAFKSMLGLPELPCRLVFALLKRGVGKSLHAQGIERLGKERIYRLGIDDIDALSEFVGDREWCFGDAPTTLDACLSSFIGNIVGMPWDYPLKSHARTKRNLIAHFGRMMARYFREGG